MTSITAQIEQRLRDTFAPTLLTLDNQSHRHAGHNAQAAQNGETHFDLYIVSEKFTDMSRLERQRAVYAALGDLFAETPLHALRIRALAPEET